jgi:magnesium chelatase subunit I
MLVFTANPEDYTARGKIITPLKDRIGSEIRTHYPATRSEGMEITAQEAWVDRGDRGVEVQVPGYVREVVEEVAFQARTEKKIDRRSGVSQRLPITSLENVASNAERRALESGESLAVPRITDVYAALPSMTGKFELEYEGEMKGAENVARDLVRSAVANVFSAFCEAMDTRPVTEWFDAGGSLQLGDMTPAVEVLKGAKRVRGLLDVARQLVGSDESAPATASAVDFVLEGLYALKKIARSEERGYHAAEGQGPRRAVRAAEPLFDDSLPAQGKKKYYN